MCRALHDTAVSCRSPGLLRRTKEVIVAGEAKTGLDVKRLLHMISWMAACAFRALDATDDYHALAGVTPVADSAFNGIKPMCEFTLLAPKPR